MENNLKIGLFGFGCVGSGLYEVLNQSELIGAKIKTIVVKNKHKKRILPEHHFSYDPNVILLDETINVVVELIDDSKAAYDIVIKALNAGKHVVSANKKLIAEHLDELIDTAKRNNVSFLYEAAVAGSIPVIRNLEEYYNNDSLSAIRGIINGTTNYILTQTDAGATYSEALKTAQELGFAEADPTLDVEGFDARYKLVILIKHAFGVSFEPEEIPVKGVSALRSVDIRYARERGLRIKLLARAEKISGKLFAVVSPHFVTHDEPTYGVNNEFNAVEVQALFSDRQLFYGKGAGSYPTASAVLSDISALKYDYKYEYRKSVELKEDLSTGDFEVKVFVGASLDYDLRMLPFIQIDESYRGLEDQYVVGRIKSSDLKDLFEDHHISITLFNEKPITSGDLSQTFVEREILETI